MAAVAILTLAGTSHGAIYHYGFKGILRSVENHNQTPLDGSIVSGSEFTFTYRFETDIPGERSPVDDSVTYHFNNTSRNPDRVFDAKLDVGTYTFHSSAGPFGNNGRIFIRDSRFVNVEDIYQSGAVGFTQDRNVSLDLALASLVGNFQTLETTDIAFQPNPNAFFQTPFFFAGTADYDIANPTTGFAMLGVVDTFFVVPEPRAAAMSVALPLALLLRTRGQSARHCH